LWFPAVLLYGLLFTTNPLKAQPFAYVTNQVFNNVPVIDTATNMVVGLTIPVGARPRGVAVTPIVDPEEFPFSTIVGIIEEPPSACPPE